MVDDFKRIQHQHFGSCMGPSEACGELARKLFRGSKPNWSIQERFSADLSSARVQKMNGNYERALLFIENVLSQAPDYSEALFVKAQILLDGYRDINRAKKYFARILEHEPEHSHLYRWAKHSKIQIEKNQSKLGIRNLNI